MGPIEYTTFGQQPGLRTGVFERFLSNRKPTHESHEPCVDGLILLLNEILLFF